MAPTSPDPYKDCHLCPRHCGTDRHVAYGYCGEKETIRIAVATLHHGEEPPLTSGNGSGTIFFTGCTLRCPFCQNHQISAGGIGAPVSVDTFSEICLALQNAGAANINLVTGTPFIPTLSEGISRARNRGFSLPILWNTSGYENETGMALLDRFVDIYLPDLKTVRTDTARRILRCPDYPVAAQKALLRMAESRSLEWSGEALTRGVIVRHLVLPGELDSTRESLAWYAEHLASMTLLSVMFQYTPLKNREGIPNRGVNHQEYQAVLEILEELGLDDGFIQALEEETEWFPDFNRPNPFPSGLSQVIWHHQSGFTAR